MLTTTQLAEQAPTIFPVVREIPADLETPVSVYIKLKGQGPSFLLESVTGGEQVARYSFIGVGPSRAYVMRNGEIQCFTAQDNGGELYQVLEDDCLARQVPDPLEALRQVLNHYHRPLQPGLPRFSGGLVGYLSYEMMRYFEPTVLLQPHTEIPDAIFLLADTIVAFDHAYGKLLLIANIYLDENYDSIEKEKRRASAEARLDAILERLKAPLPQGAAVQKPELRSDLKSNLTRAQFTSAVSRAKEYIAAGDIFQVVLSQRLDRQTDATPFQIYRALRQLNPSPYMFFFDFDTLAGDPPMCVIGASPEVHVRLEGRTASLRPIAGTRPRGDSPAEDAVLEKELLADPKERAEHVMLVDLGRNDLGRVCDYGSVQVPELMVVERYSHVMHIVSQVVGQLRPEYDAFDLLRATFPAGTVSGAPKIRAMQIIDELEDAPRGPYAGAVGYISYDGSLDTCIAIRTLVMRGRTVSIQAGAGIVADSDPESEYQETLNKASALAVAVEKAELM